MFAMRMSRSQAIANFFDSDKVLKAIDKAGRQPLEKYGAFVRRDAKGSLKAAAKSKLEKVRVARLALARARTPATRQIALGVLTAAQESASAPPGKPPRSVKGHLKNNLFFSWDGSSRSVVIGPVKLGAGVAPHALEFGGSSVTKIRRGNQTISRAVQIRPHPFMRPANEKNKGKLPPLFRGILDRAA